MFRHEIEPFSEAELERLGSFAAQASLAIGNAQLFNDLDAALERQTAMTDVLEAVGNARLDTQPVFDRIVDHARRLCDDTYASVSVLDGSGISTRSMAGPSGHELLSDGSEGVLRAHGDDSSTTATVHRTGEILHIRDWEELPADQYRNSRARLSGARTLLALPMRRHGDVVGVATFTRFSAGGYTDAEVSLLQAFTDQAAIAVDNARILQEIQQRNTDLADSLELQTATSDVLRLISAHPGELDVVLDGILAKAAQLCDADGGAVLVGNSELVRIEAALGTGADAIRGLDTRPSTLTIEAAAHHAPVSIDDLRTIDDPVLGPLSELIGIRSWASVALVHDGKWVGSVNVSRSAVRPFDTDNLRALQTFADQAAIAVANAKLFNDLDAALERQTAMTDVLDAVSTARTDLQPVYDAVARHAMNLCHGASVALFVRDGASLVGAADDGPHLPIFDNQAAGREFLIGRVWPVDEDTPMSEACRTGQPVHIRDWDDVPAETFRDSAMRTFGRRSTLSLPLLRNHEAVGVVNISKVEPGGFGDDEMSLLQAFANQAAIAVDNARLLREIEDRNQDLSESLELQTATSEVLQLISANPGDLTVVLEGIITRAAALCDAETGLLWLKRGDELICEAEVRGRAVSFVGDVHDASVKNVYSLSARRRMPVFNDDIMPLIAGSDLEPMKATLSGVRSLATIALFHDNVWIGNINLGRRTIQPFDQKQANILQAFADQAAIAVANAQLFNDLDAALERQTAMADVLEAVSTARFDIQPVFDRIADHAQRLCDDTMALVTVRDQASMSIVAASWPSMNDEIPEGDIHWDEIDTSTTTGTVFATGQAVHVRDWLEVPDDLYPDSQARHSGMRTLLTLPMRRHDAVIGVITFVRVEPGGYPDDQVALLQAFTDQAAIAVDNARLLAEIEQRNHELSESLELQTATSDILELISSKPGDLTTVLAGIAERAAALCDADTGSVLLRHGDILRIEAETAPIEGAMSMLGREFVAERTINRRARDVRQPVFLDDFQEVRDSVGVQVARDIPQLHSFATIALILDDEWIGNLNLTRTEVRPFDPKIATVLQAFADQAAIAVANAKLFNDLDAALERQTAMSDVLEAVSTARFDIQPVFDRIVEHAQRLCHDVFAYVTLRDADVTVVAAAGQDNVEVHPQFENRPVPVDGNSTTGTVYATGEPLHIRDWDEVPPDLYPNTRARQMGARSLLTLPMGRHGHVIGSIGFFRVAPGGYSDDEISLLQTFTDQAAIAVDNARLLREIEERNSDLAQSLETPDGDVGGTAADQCESGRSAVGVRRHRRTRQRDSVTPTTARS